MANLKKEPHIKLFGNVYCGVCHNYIVGAPNKCGICGWEIDYKNIKVLEKGVWKNE